MIGVGVKVWGRILGSVYVMKIIRIMGFLVSRYIWDIFRNR